jgi:hypothetical protein
MAFVLKKPQGSPLAVEQIPEEVTERDEAIFFRINSHELTPEQRERIVRPEHIFPHQKEVLAIHWHPEFVPVDLALARLDTMFPNRRTELIIPTQHNELLTHDGYSGAEVDCYSRGFNQKVQLLLHFEQEKLQDAHMLRAMLEHTRKYRASQLFDFIRTITKPVEERLEEAVQETGADEELVRFVQVHVRKVQTLLDKHLDDLPEDRIKNKLLRNFFNELRPDYGDQAIDRAQNFLKAVKKIVKSSFPLQYFYRTSEIIEEARLHGAGVVVPHPEQFWPILLAEYDVDGYEVWNPESQRYTDFLISVVKRKNQELGPSGRRILIFMGDDTHMGEKVKDPEQQDRSKGAREVGYQPAWEDLDIRKKLIKAEVDRERLIREYKERLRG